MVRLNSISLTHTHTRLNKDIDWCTYIVVHKNQLMRVYSKWYDQNGTVLIVRIFRYSLDGFLFSEVCSPNFDLNRQAHRITQVVFLALNVLTRRGTDTDHPGVLTVNIGLTAILIIITTVIKV
jgi:hypothetical protein